MSTLICIIASKYDRDTILLASNILMETLTEVGKRPYPGLAWERYLMLLRHELIKKCEEKLKNIFKRVIILEDVNITERPSLDKINEMLVKMGLLEVEIKEIIPETGEIKYEQKEWVVAYHLLPIKFRGIRTNQPII